MTRRRFLLDVDGVLADFSGGCLDIVESMTGTRYTHEDINEWSITGCPFFRILAEGKPHLKSEFWARVGHPGFCAELRPIEGAREFVNALSGFGDVYACTAPFDSGTWMREREEWLKLHMGIPRSRVIFTSEKHVIRGSVLVDDRPEYIEAWGAENSGGTGLLLDQPYNRRHDLKIGQRIESLDQVLRFVQ